MSFNRTIIGTCSLCSGPVAIANSWLSLIPPLPSCLKCGATAQANYGPTIPMQPKQEEKKWNIDQDVHTRHCCKFHGCKYGEDRTCTVVTSPHPGITGHCQTCFEYDMSERGGHPGPEAF